MAEEGFFIAPVTELSLFSPESVAFGAGLAFGYEGLVTTGYRALIFTDPGDIVTVEVCLFARVYLPLDRRDGFFIQAGVGPSVFVRKNALFPPRVSSVSGGLTFGRRFPLGKRLFIEPSLRAGYPYIIGAGVSAGFRF
jgi:hypothetical protein